MRMKIDFLLRIDIGKIYYLVIKIWSREAFESFLSPYRAKDCHIATSMSNVPNSLVLCPDG